MTEQTNTTTATAPAEALPPAPRNAKRKNEDTGKMVELPLVYKKITKSKDYKNCLYLAGKDVTSIQDVQNLINYYGEEKICDVLTNFLNQIGINAMYAAVKVWGPEKTVGADNGDIIEVDWEKAIKTLEEGYVAGETIEVLEERREGLRVKLEDMVELFGEKDPAKLADALAKARKMKGEIQAITKQIDERSAAYAARRAGKKGAEAKVPVAAQA